MNNTQTQLQLSFYSTTQRIYFGRKLVATLDWQGSQNGVVQDRLESVGKYYPFGEERNSPPLANDQVKFASYTRDSATGLDYADQRHYASTFGRFMSPDPYKASGGVQEPSSWNRYAYVENDPVNYSDPTGLERIAIQVVIGSVCAYVDGEFQGCDYTYATMYIDNGQSDRNFTAIMNSKSVLNKALAVAAQLQLAVRDKQNSLTDCNALAAFADTIANQFDGTEFIKAFGALTPGASKLVQAIKQLGVFGFSSTGTNVTLQAANTASGFTGTYQDSIDPQADQAHHFAAFLQFGYLFGTGAGAFAAQFVEMENGGVNLGDVALGKLAAEWGARLRDENPGTALRPEQLGNLIRSKLCAQ